MVCSTALSKGPVGWLLPRGGDFVVRKLKKWVVAQQVMSAMPAMPASRPKQKNCSWPIQLWAHLNSPHV